MATQIKLNITDKATKVDIQGSTKECIILLVEFFNTNKQVRELFENALRVERLYSLETAIEDSIDNE